MDNNNNVLWKNTMTYGAFLGLALVIFSIISVFIDISKLSLSLIILLAFILSIILITGISFGTKKYRDSVLGGHISYGNALVIGTLIVLFASIISAFYSYFYNEIINPNYAEKYYKAFTDKLIQFMQESGLSDDQIEQQTEHLKTKTLPSALESALNYIPLNTLYGFILSLFTSAFIKKEKSIHNDTYHEIQ